MMKPGEIRVGPSDRFEMMTPSGLRAVTLRCRTDGVVMVEQVAGGGMSIAPLAIQVTERTSADEAVARVRREEPVSRPGTGDGR
jgi:hypothetical protein